MEETCWKRPITQQKRPSPTVLWWSEVVNLEVVEISSLENALQEVEEKSKELAGLHLRYQALAKTTQDVSSNALAMCLNSTVDAPLNMNITSYWQIFFTLDYIACHPKRTEMVEKPCSAIDEQVHNRLSSFLCMFWCSDRSRPLIVVWNSLDTYTLQNSFLSTRYLKKRPSFRNLSHDDMLSSI